jgi:predicted Zn-dependent peptidase
MARRITRGPIRHAALAALGLAAACPAFGQAPAGGAPPAGQQQSLKGVVLKGKAPVDRSVLKVAFPKPSETALANGLTVVVVENHKLPIFSTQLVFRGGGLADPADKPGLAMFTAALLSEGTATRTSEQIAERFDALGAVFNANSSPSAISSVAAVSGLKENLDEALALFADVVQNPAFPAAEVEKFKARNLPQLQLQRSSPTFLAQESVYRAVYGEHPGGRVAPSREALSALTRDDLVKAHEALYRPNNAVLVVSGDVTLAEVKPLVERLFGDWKRGDVELPSAAAVRPVDAPRVILIDRPGSVQTTLMYGSLTVERTSPDYVPLVVMNQILGAGAASRLFVNLREEKGYTYGAYSSVTASLYPGVAIAKADVRTEVTEGAMHEFAYELKRIRDERPTDLEVENAKRALTGSFALSLEQPSGVVQYVVTQKLYGLPASYWDDYPRRISEVTAADIQRVARKYLDPARMQMVAVGDASKIADAVAKYGTLERFDADGRPVQVP